MILYFLILGTVTALLVYIIFRMEICLLPVVPPRFLGMLGETFPRDGTFGFESRGVKYYYTLHEPACVTLSYKIKNHEVSVHQNVLIKVEVDGKQCSRKQKLEILSTLTHLAPIIENKIKDLKIAEHNSKHSSKIAMREAVEAVSFKAIRKASEDDLALHLSSDDEVERIFAEHQYRKNKK